jgi:hypothetical protein
VTLEAPPDASSPDNSSGGAIAVAERADLPFAEVRNIST